jgi:Glycosyltransferase (GlcNAc)
MLPVFRRSSQSSGRSSSHYVWGFTLLAGLLLVWLCVTLTMLPASLSDVQNPSGLPPAAAVEPRRQQQQPPPQQQPVVRSDPEPEHQYTATMPGIMASMNAFLKQLHDAYATLPPGPKPLTVWELYKEAADKWLLPLDRDHKGKGLFPVKEDDSIFVSIASYRDELCAATLRDMYAKADAPEKLSVGLVMQNCIADCMSGVLEGGKVIPIEPDEDCYAVFCASPEGQGRCGPEGSVRMLFVNESESLGPAVARYFASKLWYGETYFMQIDSHSLFDQGWDTAFVEDVRATPSFPYSALTHYPPDKNNPRYGVSGQRICGAVFADSDIENQIIRLSTCDRFEKVVQKVPCPAPFIGAGLVFAHASFLAVAPFDPYVPWVFMGEEIQFGLRLYTWGYDIYSPTRNKISHYYVRQHKPKFWETVGRLFQKPGIHNSIQLLLIDRIKCLVGYPESSSELILPSLLAHMDLYGEGPVRTLVEYMANVGLDVMAKKAYNVEWCAKCEPPRSSLLAGVTL